MEIFEYLLENGSRLILRILLHVTIFRTSPAIRRLFLAFVLLAVQGTLVVIQGAVPSARWHLLLSFRLAEKRPRLAKGQTLPGEQVKVSLNDTLVVGVFLCMTLCSRT